MSVVRPRESEITAHPTPDRHFPLARRGVSEDRAPSEALCPSAAHKSPNSRCATCGTDGVRYDLAMENSAGSTWRRWDPHVHLPGTAFNDQFDDMDLPTALDILDSCDPPIEVLGVTDYGSTKIYREAREAWSQRQFNNIRCLFPNVELRFDIPTRSGQYVNLHLVCDGDEVDELDRALASLTFEHLGTEYRLEHDSLVRLGRVVASSDAPDDSAHRAGLRQFKVAMPQLRHFMRSDSWARERCLVGVSGGADGSSGLQDPKDASTALRVEVERLADFILASSQAQEKFWRGYGAASSGELARYYDGPKPCLHGSDAHSADRLGKPANDRFNWLKGDCSFESLLQAALSPTRAHIGESSPDALRVGSWMSRLEVDAPWFPDEVIDLNPGLVAIVGPRGSGKTALADLLAASAGATPSDPARRSFLSRAAPHLHDSSAVMNWSDGAVTVVDLSHPWHEPPDDPPAVRYLSQQFVDDLCSNEDGMSDDLLGELQRVVFLAHPPEGRLGAPDFQTLLDLLLGPALASQSADQARIAELSAAIDYERSHILALEDRKAAVSKERERLSSTVASINQLIGSADPTVSSRLAVVSAARTVKEQRAQELARAKLAVEELHSAIKTARSTTLPNWLQRLRDSHPNAGLSDDQWDEIGIELTGDVDAVVAARIRSIDQEHLRLTGAGAVLHTDEQLAAMSDDEVCALPLPRLGQEVERLAALLDLATKKADLLRSLQEKQRASSTLLVQMEADVQRSEQAPELFAALKAERDAHYESFFDSVVDEERRLKELYEPLEQALALGEGGLRKIQLTVSREVDVRDWVDRGADLLDFRYAGAFGGRDLLEESVRIALLASWQNGSGAEARTALRGWIDEHSREMLKQARCDHADREAMRQWIAMFSEWLFSGGHISVRYRIEYDGVDIGRHSPGTRGIVLLLLYLAIDRSETSPLIIDQPEENLDPESVFSELVGLFHQVRDRRQVVIVTHNANLVVNTDADQIVVAKAESRDPGSLPSITYSSGGMENRAIRAAVCRVLEGGEEALVERARRLRFDPSRFDWRGDGRATEP